MPAADAAEQQPHSRSRARAGVGVAAGLAPRRGAAWSLRRRTLRRRGRAGGARGRGPRAGGSRGGGGRAGGGGGGGAPARKQGGVSVREGRVMGKKEMNPYPHRSCP